MHYNRGTLLVETGDLDKAVEDFTQAIRLDPTNPAGHGARAWIWAAADDPRFRDGAKAVESATKACTLSKWGHAFFISALAAANAEAGNFEEAVKWETKAVEMLSARDADDDRQACKARLELYKSGQPYREKRS